jgi:glycosyltransferase involved in cell wall biosynthesis
MVSIVDPASSRSGAGTVTRSIIRMLREAPLGAQVDCVAVRSASPSVHRFRLGRAVALSFVSSVPAKVAYTWSAALISATRRLVASAPCDLVILNGSDLLWLDRYLSPSIPRLLVSHNIEHRLFAMQADRVQQRVPMLRPLLQRECRRMQRLETDGMRSLRNVLFLSSDDEARARTEFNDLNSLVVPPVFEAEPAERRTSARGDSLELGFLGNLRWWPNRDGLSWFQDQVMPQLARPVRLHVFGEGAISRARGDERVIRHGPMQDLREVWSQCDLMLCPMHTGGGVSVKLAEAVYNGMPVLTTRFATQGLPLARDPMLTVLDEAEEWVEYLNSVYVSTLRTARLSPALALPFQAVTHRERLQQFVRGLVRCPPEHAADVMRESFSEAAAAPPMPTAN